MNASHLTVRNLPQDVSEALKREQRVRGKSLNQTVIDLLRLSLGVNTNRSNGLRKLAGTWSSTDYRQFTNATRAFEKIDPDLWK